MVAVPETDQEDDRARRVGHSHWDWLPEGFFSPPGNTAAREEPRWGQRGEAVQITHIWPGPGCIWMGTKMGR